MTPTATMDANASDMGNLIDSSIDGANAPVADTPDTSVSTTDADSEPVDVPESLESPEDAAPAEDAAPTEEQPPAEAAADETDELEDGNDDLKKPDRVSRDGKLFWFRPARIAKFVQANQAWQQVQEAVPGATVDDIRNLHTSAVAAEDMLTDVASGNDTQVLKALEFLTGAGEGSDPQIVGRTMATVAGNALALLEKYNPAALKNIEKVAVERNIQALYDRARETNDDKVLTLAQNLDLQVNNKFLKKADLFNRDVVAERQADLDRRERAFNERQQSEVRQRTETWMNETRKLVEQDTPQEMIDKAIPEAVKKAYEGKPQMRWIKNDLLKAVEDAKANNPVWKRSFDVAVKRAQAQPGEQARSALVSMMRQITQQALAKNLKTVLDAAAADVMSKSQAAHQKRQQAATRREPTNAGGPVQSNTVPNEILKNAKNMNDVWKGIGWDK